MALPTTDSESNDGLDDGPNRTDNKDENIAGSRCHVLFVTSIWLGGGRQVEGSVTIKSIITSITTVKRRRHGGIFIFIKNRSSLMW